MKRTINPDHKPLRAKDYPSIGNQLDLIFKTFMHLKSQGIDLGEHGEEFIQSIQTVKDKYSKK